MKILQARMIARIYGKVRAGELNPSYADEEWVSVKSILTELYKIRDENLLVGSKILNLIIELENKDGTD